MSAFWSHHLDIGRVSSGPTLHLVQARDKSKPRQLQFMRGELIDVSQIACWAGLRIPTAFTSEVWTACFSRHQGPVGPRTLMQYEERIWQVVRHVQDTLRRSPGPTRMFAVQLVDEDTGIVLDVTLTIMLGIGDNGEIVLTVSDPIINDA
ncbi:hypothetical protein JOE11_005342 [Robbsia andropogonis]|uniref:hypothetical protein n=1 Tax=Robbsia andropogonis TaxID=28092 RepID=UPI003D1A282B